jgi:O-methyltransferase
MKVFNNIFAKTISVAVCNSLVNKIGKREKYVFDYDIIRSSSLELVSREIYSKGVIGNVAELGVYRGDFAKKINEAFPDKKLYLFDTFEGFSERDKKPAKTHDFSTTNENLVVNKMIYIQNCVIKKGYFPDSLDGLEDKFAFVSIDADLYEPTYNGLKYFYPRLSNGGYIFVHDYNDNNYTEVKTAVNKYCTENQLNIFPLSDISGSAIIVK